MTGAGRNFSKQRTAGLLLTAALVLPLVFAPVAARADFGAGVKAYEAGDYKTAFESWLPLAEKGDIAAMRNLGHLYRWGQGVEKDVAQAMHWYRKAAETGFARAQANLAAIYLQGDEGVPVDYTEAHKWFAAAAIQGLAVAQYNLGLMYELGLGVEKSEARALGWYNLAAKAGQAEAIERLSQLVKTTETKTPLVSGVNIAAPQAVSADNKTENTTTQSDPQPAQPAASVPDPAAAPVQAAVSPVAPAVVAEPLPAPQAPPPVVSPAAAEQPAAAEPKDDGVPWLLGRIYSAISSGGGVSIPDIFESEPVAPAAQPAAPESGTEAPVSRP